jgi:hypothetical protein
LLLPALARRARGVDREQPFVLREREHRVHVATNLSDRFLAEPFRTLAPE